MHHYYYLIRFMIISISTTTFFLNQSDARSFAQLHKSNTIHELEKKIKTLNHLELDLPLPYSNSVPVALSPPLSSPPFASQAPLPLPGNIPPDYAYPPISPTNPPPNANPSANGPTPHPPGPPSPFLPSPPKSSPTPPPKPVLSPPIVFPPPSGPTTPAPPSKKPPKSGSWCVAKPTVPGPIVQEALDYACGSGADCKSIQPNGSCYKPETLLSHASYAFNSYWQSTKTAGGTCDFGGTAMLVSVDPSFEGCNFSYKG